MLGIFLAWNINVLWVGFPVRFRIIWKQLLHKKQKFDYNSAYPLIESEEEKKITISDENVTKCCTKGWS